MKLNELQISKDVTSKSTKRLGRGPGTGQGCTAGRGYNGQKSRSGGSLRRSFEGGQMPLIRRVPKRGFFNLFRTTYEIVNLSDIAKKDLDGEVTPEVLKAAGLVKKTFSLVKILGTGDVKKSLKIKAHAFSKSAREKIEKAGGTIEEL
ncbi:MAG TPA: 50S ribosomal protein L15 [bacterium]|nr:50S ribosomal protein L15 [bacterium]